MPIISIVIPINNDGCCPRSCLESAVQQTFQDMEVLCVDAVSEDGSADIVREYSALDKRIKLIEIPSESGRNALRKRGVESASGKYILFLNLHDRLPVKACEAAYEEIITDAADIIEFGTFYQKTAGNICGLFSETTSSGYTFANRVFDADVCRKAFQEVYDSNLETEDESYETFIISYFADTFRGSAKTECCFYNEAQDEEKNKIDTEVFVKRCRERDKVYQALKTFLDKEKAAAIYYACLEQLRKQQLQHSVHDWYYHCIWEHAAECYHMLLKACGVLPVLSELAKQFWNAPYQVAERVQPFRKEKTDGRNIKTIAMYYHRMRNGGIERVISELTPILMKAGYRIVLVTDEEPSEDDYRIPDDVERVVLSMPDSNMKDQYGLRAEKWEKAFEEYSIDAVIYHSWTTPCLVWDELLIKGLNRYFIEEFHWSCFLLFSVHPPEMALYARSFHLSDSIVTISKTDRLFWNNYCPAYYIPNPTVLPAKEKRSLLDGRELLWIARLSYEKQPEMAMRAFALIAEKNKEVTLTMVGGAEDDAYLIKKLKQYAQELGVASRIEFTGFQKEVEEYYRASSVMFMTSMFEPYGMTIMESKGYGVPVVALICLIMNRCMTYAEFSLFRRGIRQLWQRLCSNFFRIKRN